MFEHWYFRNALIICAYYWETNNSLQFTTKTKWRGKRRVQSRSLFNITLFPIFKGNLYLIHERQKRNEYEFNFIYSRPKLLFEFHVSYVEIDIYLTLLYPLYLNNSSVPCIVYMNNSFIWISLLIKIAQTKNGTILFYNSS